jgi:hypothetical protein
MRIISRCDEFDTWSKLIGDDCRGRERKKTIENNIYQINERLYP